MKKIILMAMLVLSVTANCFAADTKLFSKEINTTEKFAEIVFSSTTAENDYEKITSSFSPTIKEHFSKQKFNALKQLLNKKCGELKSLEFKILQRETQGDIVLFIADTQKAGPVLVNMFFSSEGKVLNYGISSPQPTQSQKSQQKIKK